MGELDLDALLTFFRKNPWLAAVAIYLIASFLRAITRGVKGDAGKAKTARAPERRVADVDLQERVRAGFEQMLRERAAGRSGATRRESPAAPVPASPTLTRPNFTRPAPARPAPSPAPAPASNRTAPATAPAPVKLVTAPASGALRPIATPRPAGSQSAGLPASLQARARRIRRADDEALASRARKLLNDRSSLRSAVIASEILASPLALRGPR
ncbi:MAG TPA: hypothetical protein VFG37_04095 [Planctomycetota bacterium]|nr:hypothetical protein [Planctomycetota bacterium]